MVTTEQINIEVAFALADRQSIVQLSVPAGSTAQQAVTLSNIVGQFSEIDLDNLQLGIFGKAVAPQTVLREHDRVEIYRSLIADPKQVRRSRAEAKKQDNGTTGADS